MSEERKDLVAGLKVVGRQLFTGVDALDLSGTLSLDDDCAAWQELSSNSAARNITMPTESNCSGKLVVITNFAPTTHALTILDSASAALSPAVTVAQNKGVLMGCDGVTWRNLLSGA